MGPVVTGFPRMNSKIFLFLVLAPDAKPRTRNKKRNDFDSSAAKPSDLGGSPGEGLGCRATTDRYASHAPEIKERRYLPAFGPVRVRQVRNSRVCGILGVALGP